MLANAEVCAKTCLIHQGEKPLDYINWMLNDIDQNADDRFSKSFAEQLRKW